MAQSRTSPQPEELLEALAASLAAGASPAESLALIAGAGPVSARIARLIEERGKSASLSGALAAAGLLARDEAAVVGAGEIAGRLAAALGWAIGRRRDRRERRRAILGAVAGPLAFAALTLLSEPLPSLFTGTASFGGVLRWIALLAGGTFAAIWGLPRLFAQARFRELAGKLPLLRALVRIDGENDAAAVVAAFADPDALGAAPAAYPPLRSAAFSESFALALAVGARAKDLPARFAAFHAAGTRTLTDRLRVLARIVAFAIAAAVALHGVSKLLSTSMPGLGGMGVDPSDSPEMKELEKELEN